MVWAVTESAHVLLWWICLFYFALCDMPLHDL